MTDNYTRIMMENLERLYAEMPDDLADRLPAARDGDRFKFNAFGETCTIAPDGITLGIDGFNPVIGIIVSLYALHAKPAPMITEPFRAFKEFPGSMPYIGAFSTHTENILVEHVETIEQSVSNIKEGMDGADAPPGISSDFAFTVRPLPKITLCYIFYEADEDFPASATCLYSGNANDFLPLDALADVGEYTSRKILELASADRDDRKQ